MKALITSIALLYALFAYSQVHEPVKWQTSVARLSPDTASISFKANIEKGWHIYSMNQSIKDGPVATAFDFKPDSVYQLVGGTREEKPFTRPEPAYKNQEVSYFEREVTFVQKVALKQNKDFTITAEVTFMVCSDKMCLPPETVKFAIPVKASAVADQTSLATPVAESAAVGLSSWAIFVSGFIGGLLALLTPCVFPMLPLTVSFFSKQSKTRAKGIRNAIIF